MIKTLRNVFNSASENSQAFFNILSTGIVGGINFITLPIFTNALGTENFGEVSLYLTWVQIFTLFIGLQSSGTFASASVAFPKNEQTSYQKSILVFSLICASVLCTASLLFLEQLSYLFSLDKFVVVCILIQSLGAYCISLFNNRYIFTKQAQKNFIISLLLCVVTTIGSLILVFTLFSSNTSLGRILGLAIPNIIIGAALAIPLLLNKNAHIRIKYWLFCLPLCIPMVFHSLGQLILGQTDRIMLQWIGGGLTIVGIYSLGATIAQLLSVVYTALNNAFVPFFYEDLQKNNTEQLNQRFNRYIKLFMLGTLFFTAISPELILLLSGSDYWDATIVTPILIVGYYLVFCYSFPVNFEFYLRKTTSIAIGTLAAAVLNIVLNFVLIPSLGLLGAGISTTVAYGLLFMFHSLMAYKMDRKNGLPYKKLLSSLVCVTIVAIAITIFRDQTIIRLVFAGLVSILLVRHLLKEKAFF